MFDEDLVFETLIYYIMPKFSICCACMSGSRSNGSMVSIGPLGIYKAYFAFRIYSVQTGLDQVQLGFGSDQARFSCNSDSGQSCRYSCGFHCSILDPMVTTTKGSAIS